ncbi:MAG: PD-(D/E)XK nuclease family protein [Dokdonella sp.]
MSQEMAIRWLERVQAELNAVRRVTSASRARLVPDFNIISYIRKDEYGLSLLLADLLDPEGRHGQGTAFLASFLECFWKGVISPDDYAKAVVATEASTFLIERAARRIDIKINFPGKGVLGIENKAWAAVDQQNQVSDYLKQLRAEHGTYRLVYLTMRSGQMPSTESITVEELETHAKQFKSVGFIELHPWLKACIGECRSERVRILLEDFIDYIQTDMQGTKNMIENDVIVNSATASTENVRNFFEVVQSKDVVTQSLINKFAEQLQSKLSADNSFFDWVITCETLVGSDGCIYLQPSAASTFCLAMGFESPRYNNAIVGIRPRHQCDPALRDERGDALRRCLGAQHYGDTWPWYQWFNPYRDWGNDADAMAAIVDKGPDGMVAHTLRQFKEIRSKLEKGGCLGLLN